MIDFLLSHIIPLVLLSGWLLDLLLGDPTWLPHPVVYMGKWISWGEKRLNKDSWQMAKGAIFAVGSILSVFFIAFFLFYGLGKLTNPACLCVSIVLQVVLVFFCLAGRTLRKEVKMVFKALDKSLDDGRRQVGRIVGRDTSELNEQEIRTAALETLAENLSDGVIAPVFWYCLFGVPGMLAYKMVNTLDSMIGYQTDRYKAFGCWAAHIDDIANYLPARLTAFFMTIIGWFYQKLQASRFLHHNSLLEQTRFVCHYGSKHASPNSGWPEAALASSLDCRFGGTHNYFGKKFYKPHIGQNPRLLDNNDLHISLQICFATELVIIVTACALLFWRLLPII